MANTFPKPKPGTKVTVTTRWKDIWYYATSPFKEYTRTGEVVNSESYDHPNTFRFVDENGVHVVPLDHVVELTGSTPTEQKDDIKTWQVAGSKGNIYTVTRINGHFSCNCTGYQYRKTCKHLSMVTN